MRISQQFIRLYGIAGILGIPAVTALLVPAGQMVRDFDATWFALAMLLWVSGLAVLVALLFRQQARDVQRLKPYELATEQAIRVLVRAIDATFPDLSPADRDAVLRRAWRRVLPEGDCLPAKDPR